MKTLQKIDKVLSTMEESLSRILEQPNPLREAVNLKQLSRIVEDPKKWAADLSKIGSAEVIDSEGNIIEVTSPGQLLSLLYQNKLLPQNILVQANNLIRGKGMKAEEAFEKIGSSEALGTLLDFFVKGKVSSSTLASTAVNNPELGRKAVFKAATNRAF